MGHCDLFRNTQWTNNKVLLHEKCLCQFIEDANVVEMKNAGIVYNTFLNLLS